MHEEEEEGENRHMKWQSRLVSQPLLPSVGQQESCGLRLQRPYLYQQCKQEGRRVNNRLSFPPKKGWCVLFRKINKRQRMGKMAYPAFLQFRQTTIRASVCFPGRERDRQGWKVKPISYSTVIFGQAAQARSPATVQI